MLRHCITVCVVPDLLNKPVACMFKGQVDHHGSLKTYGFGTANMCVGVMYLVSLGVCCDVSCLSDLLVMWDTVGLVTESLTV